MQLFNHAIVGGVLVAGLLTGGCGEVPVPLDEVRKFDHASAVPGVQAEYYAKILCYWKEQPVLVVISDRPIVGNWSDDGSDSIRANGKIPYPMVGPRLFQNYAMIAKPGVPQAVIDAPVNGERSTLGPDARYVAFYCSTPDGITGTIMVQEQSFLLNRGGLLLVTWRDGEMQAKQLPLDSLHHDAPTPIREQDLTAERLKEVRSNVPAVREFFQGGAGRL